MKTRNNERRTGRCPHQLNATVSQYIFYILNIERIIRVKVKTILDRRLRMKLFINNIQNARHIAFALK